MGEIGYFLGLLPLAHLATLLHAPHTQCWPASKQIGDGEMRLYWKVEQAEMEIRKFWATECTW